METTLVEQRKEEGRYGMETEAMILDTDTHGRLLVVDGWGGNDVDGYCYRWRHGMAAQLKADDTFDALDEDFNDYTSTLNSVLTGNDPERPILCLSGNVIANIAKRHGA